MNHNWTVKSQIKRQCEEWNSIESFKHSQEPSDSRTEVQKYINHKLTIQAFVLKVQSQRWGLQEHWETVWLYWEHIERPWEKINLLASKYKQAQSNYSRIVNILILKHVHVRQLKCQRFFTWGPQPTKVPEVFYLGSSSHSLSNEIFYLWFSYPLTKSVLKWSVPHADYWLWVMSRSCRLDCSSDPCICVWVFVLFQGWVVGWRKG